MNAYWRNRIWLASSTLFVVCQIVLLVITVGFWPRAVAFVSLLLGVAMVAGALSEIRRPG